MDEVQSVQLGSGAGPDPLGGVPPRPGLLSTGLSFLLVSTKCRLALLRTRGSLGAIG